MTPFISQIAPDGFTVTVLTLGVLLNIGSNIWLVVRSVRPQRRDITVLDSFVSRESCATKHLDISTRFASLENQFRELRAEVKLEIASLSSSSERRIAILHERINDVLAAVSRLQGRMNGTHDK